MTRGKIYKILPKEGVMSIRIRVGLEGISPLLMNPCTDELLDQLDGLAPKQPKEKGLSLREKAEKKLIRDENGKLGIPVEYIFSCLVEAGRHVQYEKKRNISTQESTLLPSLMTVVGQFFPFADQGVNWKVDRRRGRAKDGSAVSVTRPRFDKWAFSVDIEIDNEQEFAPEKAKQLFEKAGKAVGLGDFRPQKRGPFGMFKIVRWEVLDSAKQGSLI